MSTNGEGAHHVDWPLSAWVADSRERIGFAVVPTPLFNRNDPGREFLAAGQLADELGFDAVFIGDHPVGTVDCWMHLAALAVTTERIRLGVQVACVYYRHPVITARLVEDLDRLSGGRAILGLGIGADPAEFAALGLSFPPVGERLAALEEAITIIRGVWSPEPLTFEGRHFRASGAKIDPPPEQRPAPPLLIAGGGERGTLRQVAQFADACNLIPVSGGFAHAAATPEDVAHKLAVLHDYCQRFARPFETILRTHGTGWLILAPDEPSLEKKVYRLVPEAIDRRFPGEMKNFVLAATPDRAATFFRELVRAGIQYFTVGLLDASDHETMRILAEEVAPRVRSSES